jgi:hypothetical protein
MYNIIIIDNILSTAYFAGLLIYIISYVHIILPSRPYHPLPCFLLFIVFLFFCLFVCLFVVLEMEPGPHTY